MFPNSVPARVRTATSAYLLDRLAEVIEQEARDQTFTGAQVAEAMRLFARMIRQDIQETAKRARKARRSL